MIVVRQRLRIITAEGDTIFVPPGQYEKIPKQLKDDKDFMYYVEAGKIEGYKPTKAELDAHAKKPKLASVSEKRKIQVLKPDAAIPKVAIETKESTSTKNKI